MWIENCPPSKVQILFNFLFRGYKKFAKQHVSGDECDLAGGYRGLNGRVTATKRAKYYDLTGDIHVRAWGNATKRAIMKPYQVTDSHSDGLERRNGSYLSGVKACIPQLCRGKMRPSGRAGEMMCDSWSDCDLTGELLNYSLCAAEQMRPNGRPRLRSGNEQTRSVATKRAGIQRSDGVGLLARRDRCD